MNQTTSPPVLTIPEFSMIALVGASSSGKSTFAKQHFLPSQVLSSDECRARVCDDPTDQSVSAEAFQLLYHMLDIRLAHRKTTVIDATNVQRDARAQLVHKARQHNAVPVAIVLNTPEALCLERNQNRDERQLPDRVIKRHVRLLKRSIRHLKKEGFRRVFVISSQTDMEQMTLKERLFTCNKREEHGPFDIIGDIHGCFSELTTLLGELGYTITPKDQNNFEAGYTVTHPEHRRAIFVGDLVDRGPHTPEVLSLVMSMVRNHDALCVSGNHDAKLLKALQGKKVNLRHGLEESMAQLEQCSPEFIESVIDFLHALPDHYMLDDNKLCVAHAGLTEDLQGRSSGRVKAFALFGKTTGEVNAEGFPIRLDWSSDYRSETTVVYGHTPTTRLQWNNNTLCLDTGCVFGGQLSAVRWPERDIVSIDAENTWYTSENNEDLANINLAQKPRMVLLASDVQGTRTLHTHLVPRIRVSAEHNAAALESISRFAVDPRWMIYVPPTMSPCNTSALDDYLEHPQEALTYYKKHGSPKVIAQLKHMGSRAVVIVLKDPQVAIERFGLEEPAPGIIMTRSGRRFFHDTDTEHALLHTLKEAITHANLWDELQTDWLCLDAELMPWNAKAKELLINQYAPVAQAAKHALSGVVSHLKDTLSHRTIPGLDALLTQQEERLHAAQHLQQAYTPYCWSVQHISDYKLAIFHILAGEQNIYLRDDVPHTWHMEHIDNISKSDKLNIITCTPYREVDLDDEAQVIALITWWKDITQQGYEGIVIKPMMSVAHHKGRLIQPAIKCRGKEYLRLIYGPEYTLPQHLERLKRRSIKRKGELALKEFSLGLEGLKNFVDHRNLYETHQYNFAVIAMESTPLDPRL